MRDPSLRDPALEAILGQRGAVTRIAQGLGISTAAVSQWRRVPDDRVLEVARILGVTPQDVRPDLAPEDAEQAAQNPRPAPRFEGITRMSGRIPMRRHRRTKMIATLGPASSTLEIIERLYRAGADVFRLNFSHGT
ncbi:MAG TPA: pyruvate kinase, partial [Roseomonas sp.]